MRLIGLVYNGHVSLMYRVLVVVVMMIVASIMMMMTMRINKQQEERIKYPWIQRSSEL